MPQNPAPNPLPDAGRLDAVADHGIAVAACGGDIRNALKAMIVGNEDLEAEVKYLRAVVTTGDARVFIERVPLDRKDWFDG